jgi:hypothetical protein
LTESIRECACGCGIPLDGSPQRRFVDDAHRKRAARAAGQNADTNGQKSDAFSDVLPVREPGRVRAGLESWLEKRAIIAADLPEVTVEAARVLADELDADSGASPLWGRYTALVETLTAPQLEAQAFNAEVRELYAEFATIGAAEAWRAERYRKAVDAGDTHPERWSHLVPIGCLLGRHQWHQWGGPASRKTCLDCRGSIEDDGEVRWAADLVGTLWDEEP